MKKIQTIILLFITTLCAQVSLSDINRLGNQQLDSIRKELQVDSSTSELDNDNIVDAELEKVDIDLKSTVSFNKEYFGYNYFQKKINFFDNVPTPADFKLGAGDEIILSLWGEVNSREKFIVNKEGLIYYKNIGFINLSNKTIKEAEDLLINKLSSVYSTLNDDKLSTKLMVELGKLKSLNIYFSGEIFQPGIHLIHPFADIFVALVQAGGISQDGSLRSIQLIRNGNIIDTVDFYTFFNKGSSSFSNIRLIDGDTIHVPVVKNRIKIEGEVVRPGYYEILENENVTNAMNYAAGLKAKASSSITIDTVVPVSRRSTDDNAISSINFNLKNSESISLNNGDIITVREIGNVQSKVEIFGRIKTPGKYSAINASLKDILDIAGGFDDPVYRKTIRQDEIVILRQDAEQFYSKEIIVSYQDADKVQLNPNDKILIYEDTNYRNSYTYRVEGEVNKPGTFVFKDGITVEEALELAQGLSNFGEKNNIIVYQEYTEINENDEEFTTLLNVANTDLDFILGPNAVIKVQPFENVVRVEGNVYNPGLVAYESGLTMAEAIIQAGGYKPYSMKKRAYVKKANGEISKSNLFRGRAKRISPGDTIVVPVNPNPSDFDITTFIADLSTTLANIAAILLIVDNTNN